LISHLVPKENKPAGRKDAASLLAQTAESTGSPSGQANLVSPAYRLELSQRIMDMTSAETYDNVTDFEWYMSVLIDLAYVAQAPIGAQLRATMLDVVSRVKSLRGYSVQLCQRILNDEHFSTAASAGDETCSEVVYAAAWICGEYSR
jgi:AP-3 complex subunit delta-1